MSESKLDKLLEDKEEIDLTLSYSRVSDFDRNGPKALVQRVELDSQGIKMGSIIDDLKFSKDKFNDIYYVSDFDEPGASLGVLCKIIISNYREIPDVEEVLNIIERNGLWKSVKQREKVLEKFNTDEFWGYLKDKYQGGSRTVITSEEMSKAEDIVEVLSNHNHSKNLFSDELEHHYQYSFVTMIGKFQFKGILDILSIDHTNKIVYMKDLKTGAASASEFQISLVKYRYYLQAAVYRLGFEAICKQLGLKGYELAPFEFVYIGLKERVPVTFIVSDKWNEAALNGFMIGGYQYKGLYELIDDIYFHWKNKVYDLSREVYENNGRISLKDDFINLK
jgi:PD-(D/E)XK nuclease superfamily protein